MDQLDKWLFSSPSTDGFHKVISPNNSDCKVSWIFRLNLPKNHSYTIDSNNLELNGIVIKGKIQIYYGSKEYSLGYLDSLYIPGNSKVKISAVDDLIMYIGGGPYEGIGNFFIRKYSATVPIGNIYQVHGKKPYKREVFFTLNPEVPASRLLCGITRGEPGGWTSWPPHQHSQDLEEVYCYFNLQKPQSVFHISYRFPGKIERVHTISDGDFVIIPEGYHPTIAMPGIRSTYFWVMSAFSHKSRRFDLAIPDTSFWDDPSKDIFSSNKV